MSKKRLLYVCPHLSTGGQPQYTYKQIKHFLNDFQIEVIEINNSGGDAYVVQKNRIKSLVPVHTLGENKKQIFDYIRTFNPDIIHFQEIPEYDLPIDVVEKLFSSERKYFIVCTTHGSLTNPSEIIYHPDKYVLVSEWSRQRFESLGIETSVWEYPIEKYNFNKEEAQNKLGLDPTYKHVLNVGLFSQGKNQGEIFAIARQLEKYKIKFHFVGNQAMNFENYWRPLMDFKPDNCIVWGERNDVDTFYEACDFFYFSSKLELNPFTKRIILEQLKPEFNEIPGWFAYKELYNNFVDEAKDGSLFVEVGAWFGKSTNYLATKIRESEKNINFVSVDTWKGTDDEALHQNIVNSFNGDIFYEFIDNVVLSNNYNQFNVIKDTSKNASNNFGNSSIDFIMIDAGHSYESLMEDLNVWYKKVKPGGYITGDDYGVFNGVTKAANEFFYGQFQEGFRSFIRRKPRIQVKHMLTRPDDMREIMVVT